MKLLAKRKYAKLLIVAVSIMFQACDREQEPIREDGTYAGAIDFALPEAAFKTEDITTSNITEMSVFAHLTTGQAFNTSSTANFMYNQKITKTAGIWEYTPLKYWSSSENDKVSFFAIAPCPTADNGIAVPVPNYTGYPAITVTPASASSQQADLCVAGVLNASKEDTNGSENGNGGGKVSFSFAHVLTKVTFSARYTGTLPADTEIKITQVKISDVIGSNTLNFTDTGFEWNTLDHGNATRATYTVTGNELLFTPISASQSNISAAKGALMLIPQVTPADAKMEVIFTTSPRNDVIYKAVSDLASTTYQAGKQINYELSIDADPSGYSPLLPWEFNYTGSPQTFTVPISGEYQLEVWGAQGGTSTQPYDGGKGGYSTGKVFLARGTQLYVYVGGQGIAGNGTGGGYNGGGNGLSGIISQIITGGGGGGGTDIRIEGQTFFHRLIVAGGGSGGSKIGIGAAGGGENGLDGSYEQSNTIARGGGGTQIAGGTAGQSVGGAGAGTGKAGEFGKGADANVAPYSHGVSGGGGGWYGGGSGGGGGYGSNTAGGGSGWIYTENAHNTWITGNPVDASQYQVPVSYYLTDASTIAGNQSFPASGSGNETGHSGNGFARIKLLKIIPE
ncbi:MAG: fimbrillin family protein [Prevotella sp.]|nr:fimbrillin family protein [Prevotella sp.]